MATPCTEVERLERMEEMLTRIDESIRGNGKPGLVTQFAVWKSTVAGLVALDMVIVAALVTLWIKSIA